MRNLRIVGRSLLRFSGEDPLPLAATAWDAASNSVICAFGPSESRAVIELKRLQYDSTGTEDKLQSIASWDAPCPLSSLKHDSILNLNYFADSSTTCLILAGGDIILVREDRQPHEELVEIVGSVDVGISAATWSPDEELVAITTLADTLLLMTRDIDNVASITLAPEDVNVSNHVSVGWGKKETQFKGKRAKALQDPTVPEHIDEGALSPFDDGTVTISWRGDGLFFAINTVEQARRRMIRVYSREGQLDSVSEPVDGLEGALSWRPSGNLVACVKRSAEHIEVVFFERNGLRHGQFDLRLTAEELQASTAPLTLRWNNDSSVLAVSYPDKIQLWTMSNYHYYLKQELVFPEVAGKTVMCAWHPEKPLSLALATPSSLQVLEYLSTTTAGSTFPQDDYGVVASIDGLILKLTPLRVANIPPPMSLLQLKLEHNPVDVTFSASSTRLAVLSDCDVAIYSLELAQKPVPAPTLLWRSAVLANTIPRHVAFIGDDNLFLLTDSWDVAESTLWSFRDKKLLSCRPILEPEYAPSLVSSADYRSLYLQFQDGNVHEVNIEGGTSELPVQTNALQKFLAIAPELRVISLGEQSLCFGLTKSGALFANGRTLTRNCTSFVVTPAHLIFTTTQHLLKFIHLVPNVEDLEVPPDEPQKDERCRSIERGARIVTVMPTTFSVVLQMPRGNLETVYPRALVLAAIRRSVENEQYGEAFLACRNQRVDMNILHDHDPERFMRNVGQIIEQVQRVEHIDLLLSQLRNEDVSETMYKETLKSRELATKAIQPSSSTGTKVNRICDAFLSVLAQTQYRESHFQNVITSHVCKVPADLEAGLEMIGRLQQALDPLTERAAEHICFLADVNQLYDSALGIYNLELALLIAQQSQKDPREYLPHLQSLHDLPDLRRKFKIDDQLGRKTKALDHLKELDVFDELKDYVVTHVLYSKALHLYQYETGRLKELTRLHADYLSSINRHKEAATAYEYLGLHNLAYSSYFSALLWREALYSATLAGLPESDITSLATSLAEGLLESKDYLSASTLHLDYLSDLSGAARLLCKGHFFSEAIRIVVLRDKYELVEAVIDPGLIEASASITEFLADMKRQLNAQVPRLSELRQKKAEDPLAFYEGIDPDSNIDIPDNVSLAPTDTTSGGTFMTRYTNRTGTVNTQTTRRTSKKKAREERKRARGKKGTVYEEEYLVNSIERLIERINGMNEELQRLVEGLVKRGMRERADAVDMAVSDVVRRCKEAVEEMHPVVEEVGQQKDDALLNGVGERGLEMNGDGVLKPSGADATLWDSLQEVERKRERPVVKAFERLSLLG